MKRQKRNFSLILAALFIFSVFASGCATTDTASRSAGRGAILGTLIGAGLGAAIGAATGAPGLGAAIGAGAGALVGTSAGYAVGQREKDMRAQGQYSPPIPDYIQSSGPPQWNGSVWVIQDRQGNTLWWNEQQERWQF
ncbi:MAG: hypothetical protein PHP25_04515 [Candidatus Moranbacteria bacterium]|nr:hypothetical protein [Candidatus Moranbacteria bacterium]